MPRRESRPYNGAWQRVRLEVLRASGWRCFEAGCEVRASTVDHIVPLNEGGARLDPSNLRASCAQHNYGRPGRRLAEMARVNRSTAAVRAW